MIAIDTMRANVFRAPQEFGMEEVDRPRPGPGEALIRVTLTTICGTDLHIVRASTRSARASSSATSRSASSRSWARASPATRSATACSSARSRPAASATPASPATSRSAATAAGYEAIGGWRFGNTIDGAQAEYLLVPSAQANLAKIPDDVTDEQVVLLADIASTGFAGAESGGVRIGDTVVVFAQGPIGLCATAGAKLMGAALVIGVDGDPVRLAMATRMGADVVLDFTTVDVVAEVKRLTGGCGADVAIEALGTPADVRERPAARCGRAARCRASASTRASSRCRTRRSRPGSATTASSRRSAPAARSGCGG